MSVLPPTGPAAVLACEPSSTSEDLVAAFNRAPGPGFGVPLARFAAFVAARAPDAGAGKTGSAPPLHLDDLLLACACLEGSAMALRRFRDGYLAGLARHLARLGLDADTRAEVGQTLLEKLLVGSDSRPPRLASYGGRARLDAWIAVASRRTALSLLRGARRSQPLTERLVETLSPATVSSATADRAWTGRLVETTLRQAIGALAARERLLLGLRFVKGLSSQAIGLMFQVNASTAHRWLAAAQAALLVAVEGDLAAACGGDRDVVRLLIRDVCSQIDASLPRLLAG